jgi:hypothetical protein
MIHVHSNPDRFIQGRDAVDGKEQLESTLFLVGKVSASLNHPHYASSRALSSSAEHSSFCTHTEIVNG